MLKTVLWNIGKQSLEPALLDESFSTTDSQLQKAKQSIIKMYHSQARTSDVTKGIEEELVKFLDKRLQYIRTEGLRNITTFITQEWKVFDASVSNSVELQTFFQIFDKYYDSITTKIKNVFSSPEQQLQQHQCLLQALPIDRLLELAKVISIKEIGK